MTQRNEARRRNGRRGRFERFGAGAVLAFILLLFLFAPAFGATEPGTEAAKKIMALEQQRVAVEKTIGAAVAYVGRQGAHVAALDTASQGIEQIRLQLPAVMSAAEFQELFASRLDTKSLIGELKALDDETARLPATDFPEAVRDSVKDAGRRIQEALPVVERLREHLALSPQAQTETLRRDRPGLIEAAGAEGERMNFILLQGRILLMKGDLEALDKRLRELRQSLTALAARLEAFSGALREGSVRLKQELDYRRYSEPPK